MPFVHRSARLLHPPQRMSRKWFDHSLWNLLLSCSYERLRTTYSYLYQRWQLNSLAVLIETSSNSFSRRKNSKTLCHFMAEKESAIHRRLRDDRRIQSKQQYSSPICPGRRRVVLSALAMPAEACEKCQQTVQLDQFYFVNCGDNHSVCFACYTQHVKNQVSPVGAWKLRCGAYWASTQKYSLIFMRALKCSTIVYYLFITGLTLWLFRWPTIRY